jgi:hypothetical protein
MGNLKANYNLEKTSRSAGQQLWFCTPDFFIDDESGTSILYDILDRCRVDKPCTCTNYNIYNPYR